jgi:hypothetical protein
MMAAYVNALRCHFEQSEKSAEGTLKHYFATKNDGVVILF